MTARTLARPRPTQEQRRERTKKLVVDAAIEALGAVGYARTSVTEIGARSGVSQGGMFRHFATRLDIVVAAGEAVGERQLANFRARLSRTDGSVPALLELTRAACRAPMNAAWHELLSAARSDAELRTRLEPIVARYYARIVELAREQPALAAVPDDALSPLVMTVIHAFDGEALARVVNPQPELDEARLALLEAMLRSLLPA
jgi:AcrR family transcriptional regulator